MSLTIPQGWSAKHLRELGEFYGGSTPDTEDRTLWGGSIRWLVPSEISDLQDWAVLLCDTEKKITEKGYRSCATRLLPRGTVAVSSRATVGDCIILGRPTCTNQGFVNIVCRPNIDKVFLLYWIRNNKRLLLRYAAGTTFDEIGRRTFKNLPITLPDSPTEQRAIGRALLSVDATIASTRESVARASALQRSMTRELLSGRLRPDGSRRSARDMRADDRFGSLPKDWEPAKVDQLITSVDYGLSKAMSERGQYPVFRMNNIYRGRMVPAPLVYIDLEPADLARYRLEYGDILLNRTNTIDLVGKVGIFALEGDYVFASYLVRLRARPDMSPRFLNYYLNSYEGQKRIAAKVTPSIGQANINTRSLRSVWGFRPPKPEQEAIADCLDAIHGVIEAKEQTIASLQRVKKALMQQVLTGKIRLSDDVQEAAA